MMLKLRNVFYKYKKRRNFFRHSCPLQEANLHLNLRIVSTEYQFLAKKDHILLHSVVFHNIASQSFCSDKFTEADSDTSLHSLSAISDICDIPEIHVPLLHKIPLNDSYVFCDTIHEPPHNQSLHPETTLRDS